MAGITRRVLTGLTILQFVSAPLSGCVLADGGVFSKYGDLIYLDQSSQSAVISQFSGVQCMLISIDFDWQESDAVAWIFPLPSDPEATQTYIVDGAPAFYGQDIIKEARGELTDSLAVYTISYATSSFVPWPASMLLTRALFPSYGVAPSGSLGGEDGGSDGGTTVTIHSHIERYGLVVEVISATEGEGIYLYLTQQGLEISENVVPPLDDYVEKDYSFVVTWVEESTESNRQLGVVTEFPTEEIFYPLILTSIYEDDVIPMKIIVTEHVEPRVFPEIEPYIETRYFRGDDIYLDYERDYAPETHMFVDRIEDNWQRRFTVIELSAPSKDLKDDLWMTVGAPDKLDMAESIEVYFGGFTSILTLMLIALAASVLAQMTVGGLYVGWKKENLRYYLILALANLIGIWFLVVVTSRLRERLALEGWGYVKYLGLHFGAFIGFSLLIFAPFFLAVL